MRKIVTALQSAFVLATGDQSYRRGFQQLPRHMTTTKKAAHWLKFNPTEWLGRCSDLTDTELGLYHRVLEKLWSTPGNRMSPKELMQRLRIKDTDERAATLQSLIGNVISIDADGLLYIEGLDQAFSELQARSASGRKAAEARHHRTDPDPIDF